MKEPSRRFRGIPNQKHDVGCFDLEPVLHNDICNQLRKPDWNEAFIARLQQPGSIYRTAHLYKIVGKRLIVYAIIINLVGQYPDEFGGN